MKGKYKAALALLLLLILVPLTLLMTLGLWVPTLAGIWLPVGTRIALEQSPRLTRHGLVIPDLRYLVNDCSLAHITQAELTLSLIHISIMSFSRPGRNGRASWRSP